MPWHPRTLFLVVLCSGFLVRLVRLAMNGPLWGDEAMLARSLLDRGLGELFQPLDYTQICPLGFLWAESLATRWLGRAEWVWRVIPTACGCWALWQFARLAPKLIPIPAAWLATSILASSVYLIRHTVEAKPYIIDLAVSLMLLHIGWTITRRPQDIRSWLLLMTASALGVWCSFPSVFAAGGVLLGLIPAVFDFEAPPTDLNSSPRRRVSFRLLLLWLGSGVILTLSFASMYFWFGRVQMEVARAAGYWQMSMWEVAAPPWQQPHRFVWWLIREHTGTMMAHPFGGKNFASLLTFTLVVSGVVTLWKRNPRLLAMLLGPALLGLTAACLQKYPYGGTARTMLYLAPAICLLAGQGGWSLMVTSLRPSRRRRVLSIAMFACLGLLAVKLGLEVACPYKEHGDWLIRQTITGMARAAGPDDVWIIGNAAADPARQDQGIPGGANVAVFDHYVLLAMSDRALHPRTVIDCPSTPGRVWVLIHESQDHPLTIDIAAAYRERFRRSARLVSEDRLDLERGESLLRIEFQP